jgi:membrane fusion protein (multidrug efflux system)
MTRERSSRTTSALLVSLVLLSLVSFGCSRKQKTPSSRGPAGPLPVEAIVIKPQPFENNIYTTGTLLASEEVELHPEISGRVVGLYFEEGRHVSKGDTLLKISDEQLLAQLKQNRLQEKLNADDERRKRSLLDINGISREDYDRALNSLNMAKAETEVVESQLAKTRILAPFDGVIGLRYVSEGSYISPSTRIATIQDLDSIKVEFSIPEKHARQLHSGTHVKIQVGDLTNWQDGVVYAVEAKVDPATRTMKARAVIPNPDTRLIPGSFSKVEITLQRFPDAIIIPSGAVVPQLEGEFVYVCREGSAHSVKVTTGVRTDRDIQITDGLSLGDTLITTGLLQLTEGRKVSFTSIVDTL